MMATRAIRQLGTIAQFGLTGLLLGLCVFGCDRNQPAPEGSQKGITPSVSQSGIATDNQQPVPLDPRLHQSFVEATRQDPPVDWQRPPDLTLAGKSVGKLYTEVVKKGYDIRF